jgi:hypothetical protein
MCTIAKVHYSGPGMELMKEIHGGMCGSHIAERALAGKSFRQGFYWPMAIKDAEHIIKTCKACQFAAKHQRRHGAPSQLITPTWPLQRWGMDIVGPLPTAQGNFKFAAVAIEYFTKWIEVRPLATITSTTIRKFFWQQNIYRFGMPRELTVDNGKQFDCQDFEGVLSFNRNKALFHICVPPSVQRRSRKSQWANFLSHKEVCFRAEERKMGK